MPRATRARKSRAAENASGNAGHAEPSCSAPAYQHSFHPVTRSMTRMSAAIAVSTNVKEGQSASTRCYKGASDTSLTIPSSAATRPTITCGQTPRRVNSSAGKPITQPVVPNDELKEATLSTTTRTAKRSRITCSQPAKDSTNHSAPTTNSDDLPGGKKSRNVNCMSQGGQVDGAVIASPTEKLQMANSSLNVLMPRKSTITSQGAKLASPLPVEKSQTENAEKSANVLNNVTSASTNEVDQLAAPVVTLARQNFQINNQNRYSNAPITASKDSRSADTTVPLVAPKLKIRNPKDPSNAISTNAYLSAFLIKQQERLLQQCKLGEPSSQHHIKGPALSADDDLLPIEPLGTQCQLCKLDLAFCPQGYGGHYVTAGPPVVAILTCSHAFHSSCLESVYGLTEPSQCISCHASEMAH